MDLVVLVETNARKSVERLCERTSINFEWRDDGRNGTVKIDGTEEECRFFVRRLETLRIGFEFVSIDGKELRRGGGEEKGRSVFDDA